MTLVEKMARALYQDRFPDYCDWDDLERDGLIRQDYMGHARAALAVVLGEWRSYVDRDMWRKLLDDFERDRAGG